MHYKIIKIGNNNVILLNVLSYWNTKQKVLVIVTEIGVGKIG